ncbi:MAG: AAA family ATPase [Polyangiaceae bacterium]|nr:AAA family ATPase [Polyangiaceae bacterium]
MKAPDPFGWVGATIDDQVSVESVAGEGAFGVVYRGTHLGLDMPIAVKCLKVAAGLDRAEHSKLLAAIRTEARLLHQLSRRSASIVQALSVGSAVSPRGTWTPYIVMEWLEGETLERDLNRRKAGELPHRNLNEALDLLAPAAAALGVAHDESVSHRDVKPGNLFLTTSRRGPAVKLVDFGIAKVMDNATVTVQTGGERRFTARYAAPEQLMPEYGPTGPWTDVYAMALIVIEVATGRYALAGETFVQLFASSIDTRLRPTLRGRGAPPETEIDHVLAKALSVRPEERFTNMTEMWAAIDSARTSHAPRSIPPQPTPPENLTMSLGRDHSAAPTGERRVCTVMSIDLSDVGRLSPRLDPEDLQELIDRTLQAVQDEITAMEGTAQHLGADRMVGVFGYPRASDNDSERAVLTALRIQEMIRQVPLPRAVRGQVLTVKIGIAGGRIFASTGASGRGPMLIGDAVQSANDLQHAAPPGTVVIGRAIYRRIAGAFLVEPISPTSGSQEAYRVIGIAPFRTDVSPSDFHGIPTQLVGRSKELSTILEAYETVQAEKRSRLVTITATPGAGRSRLIAELSARLSEQYPGTVLVHAQASSLGQETSYGFAVSVLRRRFALHDDDDKDQVLSKFRAFARLMRVKSAHEHGQDLKWVDRDLLDDALEQVANLVASETNQTRMGRSMLLQENSVHAKHRLSAAIAQLSDLVRKDGPLVLLLDDIHWADDASLDLLAYLVERHSSGGLLVVATARPELFERRSRWGEGSEIFERHNLGPLSRRHIEEMVRERLRRVPDLPNEFVQHLVDRADNNPLILNETLHLLVDAGVICPSESGAWLLVEERLGELTLPPTIQGVMQARLDRLDPDAHDLLAHAAVIGKIFWEGALNRLRNAQAPVGLAGPVTQLLSQLRARRLILERENSSIPGEKQYVFAESALQEVAYEKLSLKVRRQLHLTAAEWLSARLQGGAAAAQLAFHYDRGGDVGRAAVAYARAATHATGLGSHEEALRHLMRARDLHIASMGEDRNSDAADRRVLSWRERVRIRIELGDVLRRAGRLDEAIPIYEEARSAILRDERRAGSVYQPAEALRWEARIDYRCALLLKIRGTLPPAIHLTEKAIALAEKGGAVDEIPAMCALLAFLQRRSRRPEASREVARRGLRVCRMLKRRGERWREDIAQLLFGVAASRYAEKRYVSAERVYRQAFRTISEVEAPHLAGVALNGIAVSRVQQGDLRGTRDMLFRSLRAKERAGDLHQIAVAYSNLADVELRLPDIRSALEHARLAVKIGEQSRAGSDLADMYRNLSEAHVRSGNLTDALSAGLKSLTIGQTTGRVYLSEIVESFIKTLAQIHGEAEDRHLSDEDRRQAKEAAQLVARVIAEHETDADFAPRAATWVAAISPLC